MIFTINFKNTNKPTLETIALAQTNSLQTIKQNTGFISANTTFPVETIISNMMTTTTIKMQKSTTTTTTSMKIHFTTSEISTKISSI